MATAAARAAPPRPRVGTRFTMVSFRVVVMYYIV
jgi:hypothetical protein